jgi:hypothetical protein
MDLYKLLVKDFRDVNVDTELVPNPNTLRRMANNIQANLYADSLEELLNPNEKSSN